MVQKKEILLRHQKVEKKTDGDNDMKKMDLGCEKKPYINIYMFK